MHILSNYLLKPFTKFDMKSDQAALKITKKEMEKHIYINFLKLTMKDIVLPITIILANHSFPESFDFLIWFNLSYRFLLYVITLQNATPRILISCLVFNITVSPTFPPQRRSVLFVRISRPVSSLSRADTSWSVRSAVRGSRKSNDVLRAAPTSNSRK